MTSLRFLVLGATIGLVFIGCPRERPTGPNVLLLTVDTLRADHVSAPPNPIPMTPFIDSLLAEGARFSRAVTPSPRTTQALASLLTGLYPQRHGVRRLFDALDASVPMIQEAARSSGYRTIAVVSNHILTRERGLDRGFEIYDFGDDGRDATATTDAALRHLEAFDSGARLFAWVHYIDPHVPYFPPEKWARAFDPGYEGPYSLHFGQIRGGVGDEAYPADLGKATAVFRNPLPDAVNAHIRRLYAADVRATDEAIERLIHAVRSRVGEDWLIVFTADHGESLGEHDYFYDHGDYVYDPEIRVPLGIVFPHGPGRPAPRTVPDWVSLVDVAPTLADGMGLKFPPTEAALDGRSLVPSIRGESLPLRPVFAESGMSFFPDLVRRRVRFDVSGRFRSVSDGKWKLIWTPGQVADLEYELYDIEGDPTESRNLYSPEHGEASRLAGLVRAWASADPGGVEPATPSESDLDRLRSLGYVQ